MVRWGRIKEYLAYLFTKLFLRWNFEHIGKRSRLINPQRLVGTDTVYIGDWVVIHDNAFLMTVKTKESIGRLRIESGCQIGMRNHIVSANDIVIGKNVLTASNVYISDNTHGYENPLIPIYSQKLNVGDPMIIGENSWLGENVCVIKSSIGKNCVIGANSVVTHDIPDYCVAVGSPAKVIKRFDQGKGEWVNV